MPGDRSTTERRRDSAGEGFARTARRVEELGALLAEVDGFLSRAQAAAPLARRTRLVVEELVTNAFRHGGAADAGGVLVELRAGPAAPEGAVSYAGPAFDPTAAAARGESGEGDLGLSLIRTLCAQLSYLRDGEVNRVEFVVAGGDDI